jgi:hypothetical protein
VSYELYDGPLLTSADASWGDAPAYHTPAREFVYPVRRVLELTGLAWLHTPEDCPGREEYGTKWFFDGTVLVCLGCGLDST